MLTVIWLSYPRGSCLMLHLRGRAVTDDVGIAASQVGRHRPPARFRPAKLQTRRKRYATPSRAAPYAASTPPAGRVFQRKAAFWAAFSLLRFGGFPGKMASIKKPPAARLSR